MKGNLVIAFILFSVFISCNVEYARKDYSPYFFAYPDYSYIETSHFVINSSDTSYLKEISDICERYYYALTMDLNINSFILSIPYRVIIHKDKETFIERTKASKRDNIILKPALIETYISSNTSSNLMYGIAYLLLKDYFGDLLDLNLWIVRGVSVYEERKLSGEINMKYENIIERNVKPQPYPLLRLISINPDELNNYEKEKVYAELGDIVKFMIEKEGNFKFYLFLENLKKTLDLDHALLLTYSGSFDSITQLENLWKSERIFK